MNKQMHECTMNECNEWMHETVNKWMNGGTGGWMNNEQRYEWLNEEMKAWSLLYIAQTYDESCTPAEGGNACRWLG